MQSYKFVNSSHVCTTIVSTNSSKSLKLGGICSYVIVNVLMILYN